MKLFIHIWELAVNGNRASGRDMMDGKEQPREIIRNE